MDIEKLWHYRQLREGGKKGKGEERVIIAQLGLKKFQDCSSKGGVEGVSEESHP